MDVKNPPIKSTDDAKAPTTEVVRNWYDGFTVYQKKHGVNIRHRTILRNAQHIGLRNGCDVLEIGCGIGSLTSLLASVNKRGRILSLDISPKSVEMARQLLAGHGQVSFLVSDMSDFRNTHPFDLIVLADVIEHIPLHDHPRLFRTISDHLRPTGKVLINVPCAQMLEYFHTHDPAVLQVIDQPVHADGLMRDVYEAGLVLESFSSYSLAHEQTEYHSIVLRKAYVLEKATMKSKWALRWAELRSRIGF